MSDTATPTLSDRRVLRRAQSSFLCLFLPFACDEVPAQTYERKQAIRCLAALDSAATQRDTLNVLRWTVEPAGLRRNCSFFLTITRGGNRIIR